jgi:lipoprotein-releasing system permease protein
MAETTDASPAKRRFGGTRPFARFEWMIAGRYLRARRKEGFISVIAGFSFLGIVLGVATLIIVMAVMNGFRNELLGKILGINGHVIVQPMDSPLTDFSGIAGRIEEVAGVRAAVPLVEGQALASSPYQSSGVMVRGIRLGDLDRLQLVSGNIKEGTTEGFDDNQGVLIGRRLAQNLGLRTGDTLTLVSPRGAVTPMGTTPRIKGYPVKGVFEIGMSEYDSSIVFMPFTEAQAYFNQGDSASSIEIYLDDPDRVAELRPTIHEVLGRPAILTDWRQRNATFFSALEVERNVMFMILTLIVLVAALNIISGLIMLVKDKGPDIAILRTMGATRGAIMRVFLITGASIGTFGTFVGLLLGTLVCLNIEEIHLFINMLTGVETFSPELYFLSRLPADMNPREVVSVVLMSLTLSFLATVYPSWRAARLDPVEALRYE